MKTRTSTADNPVLNPLPEITDTTRQEIGENISFYLDLMNDPRFKKENFRQIVEQSIQSYSLSASSDEVFISFSISWKGGQE
jgi:hypothetical protein